MIRSSSASIPAANGASYPVRAGNRLHPLIGGRETFRRICAAAEAARHSIWLTVAFLTPDFRMPGGHGSLFDVLDRAVDRGLDVRALFWRVNPETAEHGPTVFSGTPEQRAMLAARGSRFRARWDRAFRGYAQHSKSWLCDAGHDTETAFVGGMNLNPRYLVSPPDAIDGQDHDLYLELAGPSASDMHHNFVQRWNEASERTADDGVWGHDGKDDLAFPTFASAPRGDSLVQIQRTVHAGLYGNDHPTPDGAPFFIAGGERSIFEQYLRAIGTARRTIYIENQALEVPPIVRALDAALDRGVAVTALVPATPEPRLAEMRRNAANRDLFAGLAALGGHARFALVGIAAPGRNGGRHPVHVHAKAMLVDDAWATIGSCNLHAGSLFGGTEMNASFWDPDAVRALRVALLAKHLGRDTGRLDDIAAFDLYRNAAVANRQKHEAGDDAWRGSAFTLDPATYGRDPATGT